MPIRGERGLMTQAEAIIKYIKEHGSITAKEADRHIGCMRLSARIYDLREHGYDIEKETVVVKTRYGKTKVARYRLNG